MGSIRSGRIPIAFFGGLDLFRAGKSPLLVFTGGQVPWQTTARPEGDVLRGVAELMGVSPKNILVTGSVENTAQEAVAVRKLLPDSGSTILLVTSAFHMARAARLFEAAGFIVHPYPVDFRVEFRSVTAMDFVPKPAALLLSDTAIREQVGNAYYLLRNILSL